MNDVSPQDKRSPIDIHDVLDSLPLDAWVDENQHLFAYLDPSLWGGLFAGCLETVFLCVAEYGSLADWDK
jgi:hypothetical protein